MDRRSFELEYAAQPPRSNLRLIRTAYGIRIDELPTPFVYRLATSATTLALMGSTIVGVFFLYLYAEGALRLDRVWIGAAVVLGLTALAPLVSLVTTERIGRYKVRRHALIYLHPIEHGYRRYVWPIERVSSIEQVRVSSLPFGATHLLRLRTTEGHRFNFGRGSQRKVAWLADALTSAIIQQSKVKPPKTK